MARIATVAGRPIHHAQLEKLLAHMRLEPRGRHIPPGEAGASLDVMRWLTRQLVTEAILAHEAEAASLAVTPERVATSLFESVVAGFAVPTSEIRAYYERNIDLYRRQEARRVRHVLLRTRAMAERVASRIRAGEEIEAIACEASADRGSRSTGGDLGDVRRGEFAGPFEKAVFAAKAGEVIGPIRSAHGWHVARVEEIRPAHTLAYADVAGQIRAELLAAARRAAFDAWLESRRRALAIMEPAYEHPGHPVHGLPRHRH